MLKSVLFIAILSLFFALQIKAQEYQGSIGINHADTSFITASALTTDNSIITGSLVKREFPSGGSGFPTMLSVGKIALRKLDAEGNQIWEQIIPNSVARITDIEVTNDQIFISGGFHDSISFSQNQMYYALPFRLNGFIASYSMTGQLLWVKVDTPNANFSKFYYNFVVQDSILYAPYNTSFNSSSNIKMLSLNGDSLDEIIIADNPLLISELEFDSQGNLYLCGTGASGTHLGGQYLGQDSSLAYLSFIAKLNSNFQQEWSKTFEYITFDYYPQIALSDQRIGFLVDTMPLHNGIGNHHRLIMYSPTGNQLSNDSVGGGVFSKMHRNVALESLNNHFYYVGIEAWDTLSIVQVDPQMNYSKPVKMVFENFGSYPFFAKNDSTLMLFTAFMDTAAIINDTDVVHNPKHTYPYYTHVQQLAITFGYKPFLTQIENNTLRKSDFIVYPNPSPDGSFQLQTSLANPDFDIRIYSMDGKLLFSESISQGIHNAKISTQLQSGIYLIQISSSEAVHSHKWIVR
jgi:hypothetical protein